MHLEEVYGVSGNANLTPAAITRLMERIMPDIPSYPERRMLERWLIDMKRAPIFAACPPLAEGVPLERLALEFTGLSQRLPYYGPIPVQHGYAKFDTASWTAALNHGKWWNGNEIL